MYIFAGEKITTYVNLVRTINENKESFMQHYHKSDY